MKLLFWCILLLPFLSVSQPCDIGYELNGINDYIKIPNTTNINSNNTAISNRTIETWFKVDDATPKQTLYEEGGGGTAIVLFVENDRLYCGAYKSNGASSQFFRSANGDIIDNTWYHVAFVISTSGGTTYFLWYLNGVLQDSQTAFKVTKHTGDIHLGRNTKLRYPNCGTWSASSQSGSSSENCKNNVTNKINTKYYFDGNLWGFRIWNSARTSTEINDNMNTELFSGTSLVAYLDDDMIDYLNTSSNWATVNANGNGTTYIWLANAISTNWSDVSNWNGGSVPSTNKLQKIEIPSSTNYPIITSEVRIGKLDLTSTNSNITINDGGTLNVYYKMTNSGTVTIKNNGAFILQDNEAVAGSGSFILERDSPDYPKNYYSVWSTPMAMSDSRIDKTFTNTITAYEYDTSQNPSAYVYAPGTDNMDVGKGYFIRSKDISGVVTRTFSGSVNNGCIDQNVYYNGSSDFYNLLGNPYPSAIDWQNFYADNSDVIGGTMYFWKQSYVGVNNLASDYISFNSMGSNVSGTTGNIAAASGFFVEALKSGTVTFKNSHRVVGQNSQFFRSTNSKYSNETDNGKLWLKLSGDVGYESILIGFIPDATDAYDSAYDGRFINEGGAIEFYSLIETDKFAIQGRSELEKDQDVQIPLGFEVLTAGNYSISIDVEYVDTNYNILLEDKLQNTLTDLRTKQYNFSLDSPNENNERFILHFRPSTLSIADKNNSTYSIRTYFSNNELVTQVKKDSSEKPVLVQMYDITGKELLNTSFQGRIPLHTRLSNGTYLVKYLFEDMSAITKKIVK